jgi:tetratricopeptide (TPR) repeat protein
MELEAADRETRRAIDLNPGYAPAHFTNANRLRHRGRVAESMAEARRALELDPLSPFANEELADVFLTARQYDLAIEQYRKTLELYPDHAPSRDSLGWQDASNPSCLTVHPTGSVFLERRGDIHNVFNFDPNVPAVIRTAFFFDRTEVNTRIDRPDPITGDPNVASPPPTTLCAQ